MDNVNPHDVVLTDAVVEKADTAGLQTAKPLTDEQADFLANELLNSVTNGRFTDTVTLVDPSSGDELTVRHATPSARRRVAFYQLEAKRPKTKAQTAILERLKSARVDIDPSNDIERQVELRGIDIVREAMMSGDLTPDDIRNGDQDPDYVEANVRITVEQFRACVSHERLTSDEVMKLQDMDWLMDQDVNAMELFVRSFRSVLDGKRVPHKPRTPMAGIPGRT